ncbi:MAG TPA: methyltransferase domain-containing protein [Thermoleophilaceae bacterium]|nr:methyltransferase domain-containing protein [Thermoleophilaceae bacterium]
MSASKPRDWDASTYDRVSNPQAQWALHVLDRLPLKGDETVLDAGCGSGRVTKLIEDRLPNGRVIAVDASPSMVEKARAALRPDARVFTCELTQLDLHEEADAVFSNAVFHWIPDHEALFARLHEALRPGGRLVAQCGGAGNIERFHDVVKQVAEEPPFAEHIGGWEGPWNYAGAPETAVRLAHAGFVDAECWLEPRPTTPDEPEEFIRTVCLGHHLERLPEVLRSEFVERVYERVPKPLELDYVRLNIDARRPHP